MEENNSIEPQKLPEDIPDVKHSEIEPSNGEGIPMQEIILPETKVAASQQQTTNPKLQTEENMEVHHHGHVQEKKKWLEYLFQFFMLFLAVFCGFLAEYQLEHKIESDKERVGMLGALKTTAIDLSAYLQNHYDSN